MFWARKITHTVFNKKTFEYVACSVSSANVVNMQPGTTVCTNRHNLKIRQWMVGNIDYFGMLKWAKYCMNVSVLLYFFNNIKTESCSRNVQRQGQSTVQGSDRASCLGILQENVSSSLWLASPPPECWHTAVAGCLMWLTLWQNEFPTSHSQGGWPYITKCWAVKAADWDTTVLKQRELSWL